MIYFSIFIFSLIVYMTIDEIRKNYPSFHGGLGEIGEFLCWLAIPPGLYFTAGLIVVALLFLLLGTWPQIFAALVVFVWCLVVWTLAMWLG